VINVENLSKHYDGTLVVDNVQVTIPAGGLTSIVGPNGAGKSTLLSMVSRLLPPSSGSITVGGLDVATANTQELAKKLAILRQDNHIQLRLTVRDIVTFGRYPHSQGRLTTVDKGHIDNAIHYLNLTAIEHRYLDQLSGGQRQRAFIAMVLCQDTEYILLDEPLSSLDMKNSTDIMKILRRAADDFNKTIVLVIHDINFASCYSDLILAMRDGKLICAGSPQEVINPAMLKQVYDQDVTVHEINQQLLCVYYT